jgi:hypothetical protein
MDDYAQFRRWPDNPRICVAADTQTASSLWMKAREIVCLPSRFAVVVAIAACSTLLANADSAQAVTAATKTTVTSSKNPSACRQSVTFTIIVTLANGITPVTDGTITFTLAPDPPITSSIGGSGQSEFKIYTSDPALNSSGPHAVTVTYNGTSTFNPSSASMTQSVNTAHDFNNDCKADILWRSSNSGIALWQMNGATVQSAVGVGSTTSDWAIVGQRDLNGDGFSDILFRNTDGSIAEWLMGSGGSVTSAVGLGNPTTNWTIVGTGDFNNDGIGDVLFRGAGTAVALWFMNGSGMIESLTGVGSLPSDWTVAFTGDFNGDGVCDILWYNANAGGAIALWLMNSNGTVKSTVGLGSLPPSTWKIAGVGDFNGDSITDILFWNTGGGVALWLMNSSGTIGSALGVGSFPTDWTIVQTGDFNGDGIYDILWYNSTSGGVALWLMNSATITSIAGVGSLPPGSWMIQNANAD